MKPFRELPFTARCAICEDKRERENDPDVKAASLQLRRMRDQENRTSHKKWQKKKALCAILKMRGQL
jgi:hypothetical protein